MKRSIGIDLGTYNSGASVALAADTIFTVNSEVLAGTAGKGFPSFVQYDDHGTVVSVGVQAHQAFSRGNKLVVWGIKRIVGLSYDEVSHRTEAHLCTCPIERGPDGSILIRVGP